MKRTKKHGTTPFSINDLPIKATRLCSLVPRGLGTKDVESLTSYTVRLAKAHCIRSITLMRKEIGPLTGKLWLTKEGSTESRKYLNGMGVTASDWIAALQILTGCNRLRELSFLHYKNVIDDKGLLNSTRCWCPECYEQWLKDGKEIYDPIAWYLKGTKACSSHQVLLAANCPECRRKQPYLPVYPELSICAHCEASLAGTYTRKVTVAKNDTESTLAELLILASQSTTVSRSDFAEKIKRLVELSADGNCALLARLVGVSSACIENWSRNLTIPKLQSFCQLCRGLRVGPPEFFAKGFPSQSFCAELRASVTHNSLRKNSHLDYKYDWNDVEKSLQAILNAKQRPQTISEIEKQMGFCQGKLYERFPDLCRRITQRHYSEGNGRVQPRSVPTKLLDEFNRSMKEDPPISIGDFADRIKYNKEYLYGAYPFISHQIRSRFREYKKRRQREWEIQLLSQALVADPPINIAEFSRQTRMQEFYLRRHHGELSCKLSQRYIRFRTEQTAEKIRQMIKAKLCVDPPPSMRSVLSDICKAFWMEEQKSDACLPIRRRSRPKNHGSEI
ncbi:TniQ family protein [bacterium]|nr:TniQ family protein [bacterium]